MHRYFKKESQKSKTKNLILVQCVEDYFYFGLFGTIVNSMKKKNNIRVEQYIQRSLTLGATSDFSAFLKSIFFNNRFRDNKWIKLYGSYCDGVAYRHEGSTNILFDIKAFLKAYNIYKNITTKDELLKLEIEEIKVGDLIYDSYLRFKPAPTVNINDFYLCIVIWQAIRNIHITKEYFSNNAPSVLLTSYSVYIQHGIAVRIALNYHTKVYSFGDNLNFYKLLTKDDWYHTAYFANYKKTFETLNDKIEHLNESKIALENRINGGKDLATSYMEESAYKISNNIEVPDVDKHIVVFLHDFFDSPHCYGSTVFPDFLEWVEFTIETLEKYNIPYCLKPHPNQMEDSAEVVEGLKIKYTNTNFISPKITNKQLVNAGMKVGVSVYGTIAHELVYMGVPIILCGDNPHSSYDFCYEAKTKEDYSNFLKNYTTLGIIDNAKEEVESFYFMHSLNSSDDMKYLMHSFISLVNYCSSENKFDSEIFLTSLNKIKDNSEFKDYINKLIGI